MFATSFPVTILSVSLTDIADEFDSTVSVLSWVITLPMIASALCLPILGKLGDLHGHRKVFLTGFTLATIVSALTALAWDPLSLIGLRSLAQVIGGATQPTSMALVMLVFAPADRVKAIGYWSFVAAGAPAIGLAVGGPLIDLFGWRLIFVVQSVLALGALLLAAMILPDGERRPVKFDIAGALSLSLVVGALMLAIRQSTEWGLGHPAVLAGFALLPISIGLFVRAERRAVAPLVPLEFLRRRNFTFALLASVFMGSVYMGGFVLAPLALRDAFGLSATAAASVMLLRTGVFSVSSPLGGQLGARYGTRRVALLGNAFLAASMAVFVVGTELAMLGVFCIALVSQGLGNGISRPPVTAALANSVPESDLGMASALQRMTQQIGNSFGIAMLTALYDGSGTAEAFTLPFSVGVVLALITAVFTAFLQEDDVTRHVVRHIEPEDPELELDTEFDEPDTTAVSSSTRSR
jgi:EmrB/QacA subfamily drug resistance transporter